MLAYHFNFTHLLHNMQFFQRKILKEYICSFLRQNQVVFHKDLVPTKSNQQ